jgi:hypothetical protein
MGAGVVVFAWTGLRANERLIDKRNNEAIIFGRVHLDYRQEARKGRNHTCVYVFKQNSDNKANKPVHSEAVVAYLNADKTEPFHVCVEVGQLLVVLWEKEENHLLTLSSCNQPSSASVAIDVRKFQRTFARPEEGITVRCDNQKSAAGYITVVPNAFYCFTDDQGAFRMPKPLPFGRYIIRAFHPVLGVGEKTVVVDGNHHDKTLHLRLSEF